MMAPKPVFLDGSAFSNALVGVHLEALRMHIEPNVLVAVAREVLHTRAEGRERWCISWLQWFWEQEIEKAIWDVKEGRL